MGTDCGHYERLRPRESSQGGAHTSTAYPSDRPPVPAPRQSVLSKPTSTPPPDNTERLLQQMMSMQADHQREMQRFERQNAEHQREMQRIKRQNLDDRRVMEQAIRDIADRVAEVRSPRAFHPSPVQSLRSGGQTATSGPRPSTSRQNSTPTRSPNENLSSVHRHNLESRPPNGRAHIDSVPGSGEDRLPVIPPPPSQPATHSTGADARPPAGIPQPPPLLVPTAQAQPAAAPKASASQAEPVSQEVLEEAPRPVKRLRMDRVSSDGAKELLKEIGFIPAPKGKVQSNPNSVDDMWPEDYIERLDGTEPTYETLAIHEFVGGYISIMENSLPPQPHPAIRRHLRYLRSLMADCNGTEWPTVRSAHRLLLSELDFGRLSWTDTRACMDMKAHALQRILRIQSSSTAVKAPVPEVITTPCPMYQSSSCAFPGEHTADGIKYAHCCAHCYKATGRQPIHTEANCKKKADGDNKRSKNGKRRRRQQQD